MRMADNFSLFLQMARHSSRSKFRRQAGTIPLNTRDSIFDFFAGRKRARQTLFLRNSTSEKVPILLFKLQAGQENSSLIKGLVEASCTLCMHAVSPQGCQNQEASASNLGSLNKFEPTGMGYNFCRIDARLCHRLTK